MTISRRFIGSLLRMRFAWLTLLSLPFAGIAQIPVEGFEYFDDLCPYLFDRSMHGTSEVTMDLHCGSDMGEKPIFHYKLRLDFHSDTFLVIKYHREPLDTMVRVNGEWGSIYHLAQRDRVHGSEIDSTVRAEYIVESTSRRLAEVIPGYLFPTVQILGDHCSIWTYKLDRKGRLKRVDHFDYDTVSGEVGGHDPLIIRYGR